MRRLAVGGAMIAGLLLSGCTGQGEGMDNGWSMIVAEDFASAQVQYQRIVTQEPNNPYAHLNLGVAYQALGDNEMAAKHYQVALANGKDAEVQEVAQDGSVASRSTTVANVAQENLASLGN